MMIKFEEIYESTLTGNQPVGKEENSLRWYQNNKSEGKKEEDNKAGVIKLMPMETRAFIFRSL